MGKTPDMGGQQVPGRRVEDPWIEVSNQIHKAALNCNWVKGTLRKLVDNPRLLDNRTFLLGTLRSLVESLDPESNPRMVALRLLDDEKRRSL